MENENLISRLFTYIFQLAAVVIGLWLSYKVVNFGTFLLYGIIALILGGMILLSSLSLSIKNAKGYNYIDFGCSLIILGLSIWCIFSACRLWL